MQYTYPKQLTYNLLTIYYVASACLFNSTLQIYKACCSDFNFINAKDGRKSSYKHEMTMLTVAEINMHYQEHQINKQTFFWKELSQVDEQLRPFVISVFTTVKETVGNEFLYNFHISIFYFVLFILTNLYQ